MADFFVLLGRGDQEIYRLMLHSEVQAALTEIFQTGVERLLGVDEIVELSDEIFQPDESEALRISEFRLPPIIEDAVANPVGVKEVGRSFSGEQVKALVGANFGSNNEEVGFQVINRRQVLDSNGFNLVLSGDTFSRLKDPGLLVGEEVHAIYNNSGLVFQNLYWARRLFDLEDYYREATQQEIENFSQRSDVWIEGEDFEETTNQWERKRICYLLRNGILDSCDPQAVRDAGKEYGLDIKLKTKNGRLKIVIPEEKGRRRELLKFLEEDFFRGPLTDTRYLANSKRRIRS